MMKTLHLTDEEFEDLRKLMADGYRFRKLGNPSPSEIRALMADGKKLRRLIQEQNEARERHFARLAMERALINAAQ